MPVENVMGPPSSTAYLPPLQAHSGTNRDNHECVSLIGGVALGGKHFIQILWILYLRLEPGRPPLKSILKSKASKTAGNVEYNARDN